MFKKLIIIFSVITIMIAPISVALASTPILPTPSGGGEVSEGKYTLDDFIVLAVNISNYIFGIVGSLALLMFVYGGVTLIFSGGNNETVTKGKNIIMGAVIGIIIVFTSYTIIEFSLRAMGFNRVNVWSQIEKK